MIIQKLSTKPSWLGHFIQYLEIITFLSFKFKNLIPKKSMQPSRANRSIVIEQPATQFFTNSRTRKNDLKNIIELTQQSDPNPPTQPQPTTQQQSTTQRSWLKSLKSYISCLSHIRKFICRSQNSFELDVNDSDLNKLITRIKKKSFQSVLPPQKQKKRILVLDLDQTLIHTTFSKPERFDYESEIVFNGKTTKIYTCKRFGLQAFLFEMSKLYEIVAFTASQKLYADKIIDQIDPKKRISHRLYRQHCIAINKSYYLKNLNILGRNLNDIIIVDDNNIAGILQPDNFYRIQPFEGNDKDRQLCRLSAFLKHIHQKNDILPIKDQRKIFEEMEINLEQEVLDQLKPHHLQTRTLKDRKRQYRHKKTNSEVEALVTISEIQTQAETTASDLIKKL